VMACVEVWSSLLFVQIALYSSSSHLGGELQSQLRIVPTVIGAHVNADSLSLNMEPPHPGVWIEAYPDMPLGLKQQCMKALQHIHDRGILHGDIQSHHFLIDPLGTVRIVDFSHARLLPEFRLKDANVDIAIATSADLLQEKRQLCRVLNINQAPVGPLPPPPMRVVMPEELATSALTWLNLTLRNAYPHTRQFQSLYTRRKSFATHWREMQPGDSKKKEALRERYRRLRRMSDLAMDLGDENMVARSKKLLDDLIRERTEQIYPADLHPSIREHAAPPILLKDELTTRQERRATSGLRGSRPPKGCLLNVGKKSQINYSALRQQDADDECTTEAELYRVWEPEPGRTPARSSFAWTVPAQDPVWLRNRPSSA
jgi:serine/threonine protein kinase